MPPRDPRKYLNTTVCLQNKNVNEEYINFFF